MRSMANKGFVKRGRKKTDGGHWGEKEDGKRLLKKIHCLEEVLHGEGMPCARAKHVVPKEQTQKGSKKGTDS